MRHAGGADLAYAPLLEQRRLLPPLTHPDPARCLVSATGLTHLGSAAASDNLHRKLAAADSLSDSMQSARTTCTSRIRNSVPAPSDQSCAPARHRFIWKA
jgi:hypothetical protein